jgi:hypothetical protein
MDVASWLQNLGPERYEAAFHENDVSAEVLCDLSAEEDLGGLGVATIGPPAAVTSRTAKRGVQHWDGRCRSMRTRLRVA